jgi:hypothetical protein
MIRRALAPTLALTILALALPSTSHAARGMELALQDDAVFVEQLWMDRDTALKHAVKLKTKRIRVNVLWARTVVGAEHRTAPATPVYDFHKLDALQAAAAARGIKLQLTLTGPAPAWATADRKIGPNRPDPEHYADFVRAVVTHFAGRVDRYSIWNEPNWNTWLAPAKSAPRIYRSLYVAGYAAIKAADPKAKVLFGELAPIGGGRAIAPLKFLREVTCSRSNYKASRRCAPLKADGFALHPYQLTSDPKRPAGRADDVPISQLSRLNAVLSKLARRKALATPSKRALNLYLTEFSYLTGGNRAKQPKVRAAWLASAHAIARRNPRVKQFLQYQLVDPPSSQLWRSGIMSHKGKLHPAYAKLARAASAR